MDRLSQLTTALSDRYRIERELGAGGMATVYLAHDLRHEREVAIKVLHPDLGAVLGSERFLSEIKTTARLQHPHILPLLDSGAADGLLYYVMPYLRGETLRAGLARDRQLISRPRGSGSRGPDRDHPRLPDRNAEPARPAGGAMNRPGDDS
jgi:serine/threonine protein kinase